MENKEEKCVHLVSFYEKKIDAVINFSDISNSCIITECLNCKKKLNDEEIRVALKNRHPLKIAKLVYDLFRCKKAYYRVALELEKNGIENPVIKL